MAATVHIDSVAEQCSSDSAENKGQKVCTKLVVQCSEAFGLTQPFKEFLSRKFHSTKQFFLMI